MKNPQKNQYRITDYLDWKKDRA